MNRVSIIALVAAGLMSLIALVFAPAETNTTVAKSVRAANASKEARALTLTRNESGQFSLNVAVNGSDVEFLVDTGADMVALTEADAEALGLLPDEEEFQPSMRTASGVGYGAQITIDEIEIGGKKLHDIEAVVVRDLGTNLLGQTVLRRLRSVELKGDKMVIRAR
ncbi:MAG: TIGR02281 family clan AA aspartic protease [Novosphingobium sp.]